ncbi:MAG: carboxypeptidase regulatory-like domain-containing protein [Candidatus Sulfotelmatobacter sp.]
MSNSIRVLLLITLTLTLAHAQKTAVVKEPVSAAVPASDEYNRLPVQRVVLYKNGVGYFEHSARVRGKQELNIDFTTSQLNDVLKSLTVVDLGEGRISSVRYNSIAPLAERLKALRLPFGEEVSRDDFLVALRGARVEVHSGSATATGKLLSVDKTKKQTAKGDVIETTEFSIITDGGEMRNFELGPGTSVRLADRDLNDEVGRYLSLVSSSRSRDLRRMTISATGTGEREVFVSYVSEVPVWKSTYRIILPEKATSKPRLQGWAIVDNTIGEDWKDVHLTLVAGAPQSFIQEISQPFYTRRPVIPLPESVQLTPQSHEATLQEENAPPMPGVAQPGVVGGVPGGGMGGGSFRVSGNGTLSGIVRDSTGAVVPGTHVTVSNDSGFSQTVTTDSSGRYTFHNVPAGTAKVAFSSPGFNTNQTNAFINANSRNQVDSELRVGSATEMVEVSAQAVGAATTPSMLNAALARQNSEAQGKEVGDFFEYDLKEKITLAKNQSALVPILNAPVEADKVTVWNEDSGALRALWLKNTSGQTLDSGTFNIIDSGTFAGEGIFATVHPNERRLLSYAADTAVQVKSQEESDQRPYTHVKIAKGLMVLTREQRQNTKYEIHNADTSPRDVVIEHPAEENWKLAKDGPKPEESSASFHRFRVKVEPGKTETISVDEFRPEEAQYVLTNLNSDTVAILVDQKRVTPVMQQAFGRILAQKRKIGDLNQQITQRDQEVTEITKDQNRLRENMKALKGSPEEKALIQRYTGQLNAQEDRFAALRKEIADIKTQRDQAEQELERMVLEISLDEGF